MRKNALLGVLLCGLSGWGWAAEQPQTSRKKLEQITEIQGYSCAKDYAWFYADGRLERSFVSKDTQFGEVQVPSGFHQGGYGTSFYESGKLHKCFLSRDYEGLRKGQEIVRPPDVH